MGCTTNVGYVKLGTHITKMSDEEDSMKLEVIQGGRDRLEEEVLRAIWLGTDSESRAALLRLERPANNSLCLIASDSTAEIPAPVPETE